MEKFYTKFNKKTFKFLSILFCYIGDFAVLLYIYKKFNNFEFFKKILEIHPTINLDRIPQDMIKPMFDLTMQSLNLMILLAIIGHTVVYILFWYEKKSAIGYVKLLALMGAPACLFLVADGLKFSILSLWFAPQAALYVFIFLGLYYFKKDNSKKRSANLKRLVK